MVGFAINIVIKSQCQVSECCNKGVSMY